MEDETKMKVIKTLYDNNAVIDKQLYSNAYDGFNEMSVTKLRERCKIYKICNYGKMNKQDLIISLIQYLTKSKIVFN